MIEPSNLYIGTAGWSYKDWVGKFYPDVMPSGMDKLSYIADYFDTVEINSSFYHIPSPKYAEGWIKKVSNNPKFRFTLKLWQGFTHQDEYPEKKDVENFINPAKALKAEGRLGGILVQFPWSFKNNETNQSRLSTIFEDFKEFPIIVEVRHKSWANDNFYKFLENHNAGFCNIDQPMIGESIVPSSIVTGNIGYVRFHGRNYEKWFAADSESFERYNYLYSEEELAPWVDRIKEILNKNIDTYVITNNHWQGKAAHTALMIKNKVTQKPVKVPESLADTYPELNKIRRHSSVEEKGEGLFDRE